MKIITITLNPAVDVHYEIEGFVPYKENYADNVIKQTGGKGINISRGLTGYGIENTAYCVLGNEGSEEFLNSLRKDGVSCIPIITEGRIRENITLHSKDGETRISCEGFTVDKSILDRLFSMIEDEKTEDMMITFTGRLPKGISKEEAIEFLLKLKKLDAKVVVDCNSFSAEDLFKIKPYLIKPNEQEVSSLISKEVETLEDAYCAAKDFCLSGVENVIVSLGKKGFAFYGKEGGYLVKVPGIDVVSTIGAGDSSIAGFVAGDLGNMEDTLKLSAAFGTAACLTEGTNPPCPEDIEAIKEKIECIKLN